MANTTQFFRERMPTLTRGAIYVVLFSVTAFREDLRDLAAKGIVDAFSWIDVILGFGISSAIALGAYLDKTHTELNAELKAKRAEAQIAARTAAEEMAWVKSNLPKEAKP